MLNTMNPTGTNYTQSAEATRAIVGLRVASSLEPNFSDEFTKRLENIYGPELIGIIGQVLEQILKINLDEFQEFWNQISGISANFFAALRFLTSKSPENAELLDPNSVFSAVRDALVGRKQV